MARYRPRPERLEELRLVIHDESTTTNFMHIAHSKEIMRDLFAEIDALRAENDALRAALRKEAI